MYLAAELEKMCYDVIFDEVGLCSDKEEAELRLKNILRMCCLGMIVLSDEFLRSEVCMAELAVLVRYSKWISLFFRLSIDEFLDQNRMAIWKDVWESWQAGDAHKQCASLLSSKSQSFDYSSLTEATLIEYVQIIAEAIHQNFIAIQVCWSKELSHIQGKERMCKEVDGWFYEFPPSEKGIRMLGIHGEWVMGKTTLAKCLCNFYSSKFLGRVHHLDLSSSSSQLQLTKDLLKNLLGASPVFLGRCVKDLGQAYAYLDHCLQQTSRKVFLVVDHIEESWESQEKVNCLYLRRASFPVGSMILFLARTSDALEQLLLPLSSIKGTPKLNFQEGFNIFGEVLLSGLCGSEVTEWHKVHEAVTMADVLSVCVDQYPRKEIINPVRFMSLGYYFRDKGVEYWLSALAQKLSFDVFKDIRELKTWKKDGILGRVFEVAHKIYDSLDGQVQQVFLDIALYIPKRDLPWMWRLHDRPDTFHSATIECVQKLISVTFVTIEERKIKMHSSCRPFAEKLARDSIAYVYVTDETVKETDVFNKLQRGADAIERVAFEDCVFDNGDASRPFVLDLSNCKHMKLLRLLNVRCRQVVEVRLGCSKLLSLEISSISNPVKVIGDVSFVKCLSGNAMMVADSPSSVFPLHFESLEVLETYTPRKIWEDSEDGEQSFEECNFKHFQSGCELEVLSLAHNGYCSQTGELELYSWLNLKELTLSHVCGLRKLSGLQMLQNLRTLHVQCLDDLTTLAGIESLSRLKKLHLIGCKQVSELRLPSGNCLTHCCIRMCERLILIEVVDEVDKSSSDYDDEVSLLYGSDWWMDYSCRDDNNGATICSDPEFSEDFGTTNIFDVQDFDTLQAPHGLSTSKKRMSNLVHFSTTKMFDVQNCGALQVLHGLLRLTSIDAFNFKEKCKQSMRRRVTWDLDSEEKNKQSSLQVVSPGALDFERFIEASTLKRDSCGDVSSSAHQKPYWIRHCEFVKSASIAHLCILDVEGVQLKGFVQELMKVLKHATSLSSLVVRCAGFEASSCGCDKCTPCFSFLPESLSELEYRCSRVQDLTSIGNCTKLTGRLTLDGCTNVKAWPDVSLLPNELSIFNYKTCHLSTLKINSFKKQKSIRR